MTPSIPAPHTTLCRCAGGSPSPPPVCAAAAALLDAAAELLDAASSPVGAVSAELLDATGGGGAAAALLDAASVLLDAAAELRACAALKRIPQCAIRSVAALFTFGCSASFAIFRTRRPNFVSLIANVQPSIVLGGLA